MDKSMTLETLDILTLCFSRTGYTFCQKSVTSFFFINQHYYNNVHFLIYGKFIGMWYVLLPVIFPGRKSSRTCMCLWVWLIKLEVIVYCVLCYVFSAKDILCWLIGVFFKSAIYVVWIANFLFFEKLEQVMCAIRKKGHYLKLWLMSVKYLIHTAWPGLHLWHRRGLFPLPLCKHCS